MNIICEDGSWRDSAANMGDPIQDCKGEDDKIILTLMTTFQILI